ncbi:MAG: hypothetical protein ABW026_20230 [Microvirga sp.]
MNDEGEVSLDHALVAHQDHAVGYAKFRRPRDCRNRAGWSVGRCWFLRDRRECGNEDANEDCETAIEHMGLRTKPSPQVIASWAEREQLLVQPDRAKATCEDHNLQVRSFGRERRPNRPGERP